MDEPNVPYFVVLVIHLQPLKCKLTSLWTAWLAPNNANWEKIGRSRCLSPGLCDMSWTTRSPACRWLGLCVHTLIRFKKSHATGMMHWDCAVFLWYLVCAVGRFLDECKNDLSHVVLTVFQLDYQFEEYIKVAECQNQVSWMGEEKQ